MITDKYSNPTFQERDIFDLLYKGHSDKLDQLFVEPTQDIQKLFDSLGISPKKIEEYEDVDFFDEANQSQWFIPENYCSNLVEHLYSLCKTEQERARVDEELTAFIEHKMFDMLFCLKYIVDTLRSHNIVWGVGRGSSVASFVLYLLGVHKIDSIKYNLDWREFLR
jgi:DNA polymerase III alpha subunit